MTWTNEIVRIVRFLINDVDSATYSDDRLEETVLVAAQLLLDNINFANTYTVDVDTLVLLPDPTQTTPKDNIFINAVALKTACIVLGSEAKTLASQNYRIKDGPSSIDSTMAYSSVKQLHTEMSAKLDKYILDYLAGNSVAGTSILTPYTQDSLGEGSPIRNYE